MNEVPRRLLQFERDVFVPGDDAGRSTPILEGAASPTTLRGSVSFDRSEAAA